MKKMYDVVIVGAGPAGLMTALTTAKSGLRVLLVEQKKDIDRVFRSCCCNLIIEPGTHAEAVSYCDGAIHFAENSFSVPYSGSVIPLKNSFKVAAGGEVLRIHGKSPEGFVAVSYEKEVLLRDLLAGLKRHRNVDIMTEVQGTGAENISGGVRVHLRTTKSTFTAGCRVAVAADGVNSKITESLGLNRTRRTFFARFKVASYHMDMVDCPYPEAWITFIGKGHTLGGRGQLYMCPKPHEGRTDPPVYELTIGVPYVGKVPVSTPAQELEHFTRAGRFSTWFQDMKILETRAATLNFFTPLVQPVEGNVVVVGDAAAFIETYVQGAVMYGFQAGKAIVAYLATGSGLEAYADAWKRSFEYNDPEEIRLATQGFGLHVLRDEDLGYLFSLTKNDTIRGFVNEFSDPITVRRALLSHIKEIERDRPELAVTMKKFSQVSVDNALQVD